MVEAKGDGGSKKSEAKPQGTSRARQPTMAFAAALWVGLAAAKGAAQTITSHSLGNALEAQVLVIEGAIEPGASDRLRAYLGNGHEGYRLSLNSPGGSLIEGMLLGEIIREHEFHTEVGSIVVRRDPSTGYDMPEEMPGFCASACALAFLGGVKRDEGSATRLGFHQFSLATGAALPLLAGPANIAAVRAETMAEAQVLSGIVAAYMAKMGADARLFAATSLTRADDLLVLTKEQAIEYDVVTPTGFDRWFIEPYRDGVVAASLRIDPPRAYSQVRQATIFCREGRRGEATMMLTAKSFGGDLAGFHSGLAPEETGSILTFVDEAGAEQRREIPVSRTTVRNDQTTIWIEILMELDEIRALLGSRALGAAYNGPRAAGGFYAWHEFEGRDREMIRSALNHCV